MLRCVQLAHLIQLALTNGLEKFNHSFVADLSRGYQVWNQPIFGFSFSSEQKQLSFDLKRINVNMTIFFVVETLPSWNITKSNIQNRTYFYSLDVKSSGKISGGNYQNIDSDRPDFVWQVEISDFFGYFSSLKDIYLHSTNDQRVRHKNSRHLSRSIIDATRLTSRHGNFSLDGYGPFQHKSWSIFPDGETELIQIRVSRLEIERFRDSLRIYEHIDGSGALVAVLHGNQTRDQLIDIHAPGALVVFESDGNGRGSGFQASYSAFEIRDI